LCASYRGRTIIRIPWLLRAGGIIALITGPAKVLSPAGIDFFPGIPSDIADIRLTSRRMHGESEDIPQTQTVHLRLIARRIAVIEGIIRISPSIKRVDAQDFS